MLNQPYFSIREFCYMRCTCSCTFPIRNQWMFANRLLCCFLKPFVALGSVLSCLYLFSSLFPSGANLSSVCFFHFFLFLPSLSSFWIYFSDCIKRERHLLKLVKLKISSFPSNFEKQPELLSRYYVVPLLKCFVYVWWFLKKQKQKKLTS